MMEPLVEVSGLSVTICTSGYEVPVLTDVSFNIYPGQVTALLGESGSGKSTIASLLTGVYPRDLYRVDAGHIWWTGDGETIDLLTLSPMSRLSFCGSRIGHIFQEPDAALNPTLTIGSQLAEISPGPDAMHKMNHLLGRLDIDPESIRNRYPWQLSGGQQQRVLLAQALYPEPLLLIADEPTAALDKANQKRFLKMLRSYLTQGSLPGMLFITHDQSLVEQFADTMIFLKDGRIQSALHEKQAFPSLTIYEDSDSESGVAKQANLLVEPLLAVKKLEGGYKEGIRAFEDVQLKVYPGEIHGIAGASGSGKSSLLRGILGLLPWQKGIIESYGKALSKEEIQRLCKLIYQDPGRSLNPVLTIRTAFKEILCSKNIQSPDMMLKVLAKVQLKPEILDRLPHMFSGGQKQRIAIAKTLLSSPKVLLCDEPFSSLDTDLQYELLAMLQQLCVTEGLGVVLVAHDLPMLMACCRRISVLDGGKIIFSGTPQELSNLPSIQI